MAGRWGGRASQTAGARDMGMDANSGYPEGRDDYPDDLKKAMKGK